MIGWGWIVLTGTAIQSAGSIGAILAFIIGGLAIVLVGLTYAELASAMPKVGGEHVYSYRALGHLPSFLCTWAIILGYLSVVAFEAVALPTVIEHLAPNYAVGHLWTIAGWEVKATWVAVGVGGSLAMMIINYFGVTTAALLQKVVTSLILLVGVLFITGALFEGETINMMPLFTQADTGVVGRYCCRVGDGAVPVRRLRCYSPSRRRDQLALQGYRQSADDVRHSGGSVVCADYSGH